MDAQMDAQKDLLCFDLMDFDMKTPVFPDKAATFIITMTGIPTPTDQIPMFNGHYAQRIGTPNSFEAVTFYSDFLRVVNQRELTPAIKQIVIDFFDISFTYDPTIDMLCSEVFQPVTQSGQRSQQKQPPKRKQSPQRKCSPPQKNKRTKNYNDPILRTSCENCKEKDLRMKLIKKTVNCDGRDLMKLQTFWNVVKMENRQLATLPPINEIDPELHQQLLTLMENRGIDEYNYLNEELPDKLNQIKLDWYENRNTIQAVINVPETESDASA